ncbi:MAG TPA: alpha-hydroxy-acid oxidizing protein, partial [Spirochaetia bacterium]|nr:alpha-hydroxy-acid oxidizing protein [Spirochaetia bacterium]
MDRPVDAVRRQADAYLSRIQGKRPSVPFGAEELEAQARRRLSPTAYAYIAGGAGTESTIRANREALDRLRILPRVLHDVGKRSLEVELFGRSLRAPLLLAPVGVLELAHREADVAVARAAAAERVPFIFSNQASVPMEQTAAAMGERPRWFQLYYSKSDELVESLVGRAERAGCEAIVVTLDTTLLGYRTRDLDLTY